MIAIATSFGCRRDSKPDSPATSKACYGSEARHTEADTRKPRNEFRLGRAAQLRDSEFHRGLSIGTGDGADRASGPTRSQSPQVIRKLPELHKAANHADTPVNVPYKHSKHAS